MPHFALDCSENIIKLKSPQEIIQAVYNVAESTELFVKGDKSILLSTTLLGIL